MTKIAEAGRRPGDDIRFTDVDAGICGVAAVPYRWFFDKARYPTGRVGLDHALGVRRVGAFERQGHHRALLTMERYQIIKVDVEEQIAVDDQKCLIEEAGEIVECAGCAAQFFFHCVAQPHSKQ